MTDAGATLDRVLFFDDQLSLCAVRRRTPTVIWRRQASVILCGSTPAVPVSRMCARS